MAELWKGAPAAAALMEDLTGRIERLSGAGVTPTLAIVRVGSGRTTAPMRLER